MSKKPVEWWMYVVAMPVICGIGIEIIARWLTGHGINAGGAIFMAVMCARYAWNESAEARK